MEFKESRLSMVGTASSVDKLIAKRVGRKRWSYESERRLKFSWVHLEGENVIVVSLVRMAS